jgi:hypothetical protein
VIRGREFLEVRQFLLGMAGEASARTRTGRAYQAAYLEALAYCEHFLSYRRRRGASDHAELARVIAAEDLGLAGNLENLRKLRNAADYDVEESMERIARDVMWSGVLARSIISRLDVLTAVRTAEAVAADPEARGDQ